MNGNEFKKAFIGLIEATSNPLAPIIVHETYGRVEQLGKMLTAQADEDVVQETSNSLLSHWSDAELELICGKPEFIIALAAMLNESLTKYVATITAKA